MNDPSEIEAVRRVVEQYIDGSKGNPEILRAAFHPDARMTGYFGGRLLIGSLGLRTRERSYARQPMPDKQNRGRAMLFPDEF